MIVSPIIIDLVFRKTQNITNIMDLKNFVYLEKIAQPYYFGLRISDDFAEYDDRIALNCFG